jgi:hypothetical protein
MIKLNKNLILNNKIKKKKDKKREQLKWWNLKKNQRIKKG